MIVIADASPLNYLIQLECSDILESLYAQVLVPQAVLKELQHERAPRQVRAWLLTMPSWIEVCDVAVRYDESLGRLGPGECEAILLAQEKCADLLLIDERRGEVEAKRRGIATTGTLGVLLAAGTQRLLIAEEVFQRLISETTFRATAEVQKQFLERCKKLKQ
jgi:uncharacterized protein